MRTNRKMILALVLMVVLLLVLVGCRQAPVPEPEETVETPEAEMPEDVEEEQEDQWVEAEGRYVGFADSNSVEIELIGESQPFMVFQLHNDVRDQLEEEEYDTGTEVNIRYRVLEQGQPMIMEITAK